MAEPAGARCLFLAVVVTALSIAACTRETQQAVTTTMPERGNQPVPVAPASGGDGNRVAALSGSFDVVPGSLRARPAPVVRVDLPADDVIAVGYEDGELRLIADGSTKVRSASSMTGIVYTIGDDGIDVLPSLPGQAPHGRPGVRSDGTVVYVTTAGDVVVWDGNEVERAPVDALADGDVLVDDEDRVLVLTGPTERYPHGILGDRVEASGFVILEPSSLRVVGSGTTAAPAVIEGRRAIWTDVDGDGVREVFLTVSEPGLGARWVMMDENGAVIREGSPIGRSNRWRHAIAVAQFLPSGLALAEIVTPHIGGDAVFSEVGSTSDQVGSLLGFTSHFLGVRELDMAVALDVDGDGLMELLVPTQDARSLAAIGLTSSGPAIEWRADLPAAITSNISVGLRNGVVTIAVGTADGAVHLWSAGA